MKYLISLITVFSFLIFNGQTTGIPDANFEQALIDLGYDTGSPDGSVPTANISSIGALDVSYKNISDLTGIEAFTALTILNCENNQLSSLDVSNNIALGHLDCGYNQLPHLDVSNNVDLYFLQCSYNQLTHLDVSGATALTDLHCRDNQLTSLDVSNNIALYSFECMFNQLTHLDVSGSTALTYLYCDHNQLMNLNASGIAALNYIACNNNQLTCLNIKNTSVNILVANYNPNLTCIEVDDVSNATANVLYQIDSGYYSNNCNNACSNPIGNSQCQADFAFSDSNCVVTFSNNSTGAFSYLWDFGDGSQSTQENPTYTYSSSGTYMVMLNAYDSTGSVCNTYDSHLTINCSGSIDTACQVEFTWADSNCVVTFSNNSSGVFSYLWDFGDGNQSTLENPVHTYSISGTYDVMLNALDSNGVFCHSLTQIIVVNCSYNGCQANFNYTDSSCVVFFNNSSTGPISSYQWDFGDGSQSQLQNPTHTYSSSGTYNVILSTFDSSGVYCNSISQYVVVTCNCTYYDTTHVTIYDTVSISVMDTLLIDVTITSMQTPNNTNTIKVYPNPTNDVIYIDNGNYSMMSGYSINILNSGAQSVYSSPINTQTLSLNVSQLGAIGTYFLQILDTSMNVVEIRHIVLQ